jgi:uncharacterized membrane protein
VSGLLNERDSREEAVPGTGRVEAFTDGVFAVVATLLVLDLHVPQLPESPTSQQLWQALRPLLSTLLSFGLSFLFVMIVWVNHHQIFHSLKKADRGLLWANNLLLFWMCLLPFPTAFLGAYPRLPLAPFLLSLVLCGAAVAIFWLARHADRAELYHVHVHAETRATIRRRSWVGPPAFLASACLAGLSTTASIVAMFAVMAYYCIPARIVAAGNPAPDAAESSEPA